MGVTPLVHDRPGEERAREFLKQRLGDLRTPAPHDRITGQTRLAILYAVQEAVVNQRLSLTTVSRCLGISRRRLARWRLESTTGRFGTSRNPHRPPGSLSRDDRFLLIRILRMTRSSRWSCRRIREYLAKQYGRTISHVSIWKYKKLWGRSAG